MSSMVIIKKRLAEEQQQQQQKKKKRQKRSPYLRRRQDHGHFTNLMKELAEEDPMLYRNFLRFDKDTFYEIVERVRPLIEKQTTWWREPFDVGLRVGVTLRFLATGDTYKSLGYAFRVAPNTLCSIIPETCRAIIAAYGDEVLKMPDTPEGWKEVAKGFQQRWNFPHIIGAIDGKHIHIRNPPHAGSKYFNYKKFYSIVLLAVVDSDYKFLYIDVGAVGAEADAGIFAQSRLASILELNQANFSPAEPIPGESTGHPIPYYLLGDDAFALRDWMMKPFPSRALSLQERIFNYRQSRARRVVENAFGILANRYSSFKL